MLRRRAAGRAGAGAAHAADDVPAAAQPEGDGAGERPRDPGDRREERQPRGLRVRLRRLGRRCDAARKPRGVPPNRAPPPRDGRRQQDRHVARRARTEAGVPDHDRARRARTASCRKATRWRRSARTAPRRCTASSATRTRSSAISPRPARRRRGWRARSGTTHATEAQRLGAAKRGGRRDVAQRDGRSSVHAEPRRQHPQRLSGLRSRRAATLDAERHLGLPRVDAQRLEAADRRQGHPERRGCRGGGEVRRERHHRVEPRRPRVRRRRADPDGAAGMRGRGRRKDSRVHRRRHHAAASTC